jgi:hypothetical protein
MATRRLRPEPSATPPVAPASLGAILLAALALPRIIRMLYPAIWVEDDCYLESAFAIASGLRPYLDFVHPQTPVLEWLAAAYIKLVGASHFKMELLNESAIWLASVLTFVLGTRAVGRTAAVWASLLLATSSLVFRYHVWAREIFVAALVLGAALAVLDRGAGAV